MAMTRLKLAALYNIDYSTLWGYMRKYKRKIDALATKINIGRGKTIKIKRLNRKQIQFIVKTVMQDPPEGYKCISGKLIKLKENE